MYIDHAEDWERYGQGRRLSFYSLDHELLGCLFKLPKEYGPFRVVGTDVRHGEKQSMAPYEIALDELPATLACRRSHWIWPFGVMPDYKDVLEDAERGRSLNGLISIDFGTLSRHGAYSDHSISLVDQVIHKETGLVVQHKEQLRLFNSLKGMIRRSLCYSTVHVFPDNNEVEDVDLRMTRLAAEAHLGGEVRFRDRPGRILVRGTTRSGKASSDREKRKSRT